MVNNRKIIMDCDPGHDDAIALIIAGAETSPLDIVAVTTVAGNQSVDKNTRNALNVLDIMQRGDIPVSTGADRPLIKESAFAESIHGETGLDGPQLPKNPKLKATGNHGVKVIVDEVLNSDEPITIVATGPLTNVAMALIQEPKIAENIQEIVIMGGGTFGNWTPTAEFNIWVDGEAAKKVFNSGVPVVVFGLDVTHQLLGNDTIIERFNQINNPVSQFVVELLKFFKSTYKEQFDMDGGPIHDACTILYLLNPKIFTLQHTYIQIENQSPLTYGTMSVDLNHTYHQEPNAHFATAVDIELAWNTMEKALRSYPSL
ncbi:nucleoside hydrolase [Mammaliicoccus sp. Dog046]|uniref:nucleoside hydrolase n=1 Tax=Mammaliicoccus sp. Dog046 TaxID=3034233 RepID=UPI002B25D08F|nr:nucleoside hydrolase [Mammaliicoccus sp. Dog046]WQK85121.1 nucleoside hydrolase [Mammaliicoccus sp. Dog046]